MRLFLFIVIISFFITKISFSQNCDTVLIKKLYQEANKTLSIDLNKAYDLSLNAFSKSKNCQFSKHYFESLLSICAVYYQKDEGDSIIKLLLPIIAILPANVLPYYKAAVHHKLSSAYAMIMQSENSLKNGIIALKNYELIKDTANTANILVNIANVYQQQNNFKQADNYIRKAEAKAKLISRKTTLGNVYNTMGILYAENGKLDSAEKFFLNSIAIREALNDNISIAWNYNNLGGLYVMLNRPEEAIVYLEKALEKFKENKNVDGQTSVTNNLGGLNIQIKDYKKALEYFNYSRQLYAQINDPDILENLYRNLRDYYNKTGDIKTAFEYSDSLIVLNDSLYGSRLNNSIAEMQTKYDVGKKDLELAKNKADIEIEKNKRYITYGALAFFILLLSIAIYAFVQKRKTGKLLQTKNSLLENANQEISHQKEQLTEKQKEIVDSINYAKKIQTALLASEEMLLENSVNHFTLFKPKDIVSGDFTWATKKDDLLYIACCDSTGHGVPGAFMSLLNIGFLSEAIKERNILKPGDIFNYVRDRLIETIGKDEQQDGFDGIILCIETLNPVMLDMSLRAKSRSKGQSTSNIKITYAAANNAPIIIRDNEIIQLKCNKMPVGKGVKTDSFDTFNLNHQPNDSLYLFTDGYPDQFGGPKGKKFKYKPLEELLLKNQSLGLSLQKEKLNATFEEWRGDLEQVDDVCIIGVKL